MKTLKICMLSLMFISLSMIGLTAVATTPDGETPLNEGVCNDLVGTTPGLYGLCVAFCEAQDCEATYDPATETVTFDENCRASSPKILANFNKRAGEGGPHMPCVNITENECPCWTEVELDAIPHITNTVCNPPPASPYAQISTLSGSIAYGARTDSEGDGFTCNYGITNQVPRMMDIDSDQNATCFASIVAECADRGLLPGQ